MEVKSNYVSEVKIIVIVHSDGSPVKEFEFDHDPANEEIMDCLSSFEEHYMYATIEKRFYK